MQGVVAIPRPLRVPHQRALHICVARVPRRQAGTAVAIDAARAVGSLAPLAAVQSRRHVVAAHQSLHIIMGGEQHTIRTEFAVAALPEAAWDLLPSGLDVADRAARVVGPSGKIDLGQAGAFPQRSKPATEIPTRLGNLS